MPTNHQFNVRDWITLSWKATQPAGENEWKQICIFIENADGSNEYISNTPEQKEWFDINTLNITNLIKSLLLI